MAAESAAQKGSKMERQKMEKQAAELDKSGYQNGKNSTACNGEERGQLLGHGRRRRNSSSARSFWKFLEFDEFLRQRLCGKEPASPAAVGGGTV